MSQLKNFFYSCVGSVPINLLVKISPMKSLFPYHHIVSDEEVPHIQNLYSYKNIKQFSEDLEYLLKHFKIVHPEELYTSIIENRKIPKNRFLLSFDDGFKEVYSVIAPILFKKGVPAMFFINPAFIGNTKMFYRNKLSVLIGELRKHYHNAVLLKKIANLLNTDGSDLDSIVNGLKKINQINQHLADEISILLKISFEDYLRNYRPWLLESELESLNKQGFTIGAHSWDHPFYKYLSLDDQLNQTTESCAYVQKITKSNHVFFSFPHSDTAVSQDFFDLIQNKPQAPGMLFGIQNQKNEIKNGMIHRFNAERQQSMEKLAKGIFLYSALQNFNGKQIIRRTNVKYTNQTSSGAFI